MDKAKTMGMRFNLTKCQFHKKNSSDFFGLMLKRQGVVPNPAKIEALSKLPEPKNREITPKFLRNSKLFVKI